MKKTLLILKTINHSSLIDLHTDDDDDDDDDEPIEKDWKVNFNIDT